MHVLISYDISKNKTRQHFHRFLKEFGLNTQKSVFECDLDQRGIDIILSKTRCMLDPVTDTLRLYRICAGCQRKVVVSGLGLKVVQLNFMIL